MPMIVAVKCVTTALFTSNNPMGGSTADQVISRQVMQQLSEQLAVALKPLANQLLAGWLQNYFVDQAETGCG